MSTHGSQNVTILFCYWDLIPTTESNCAVVEYHKHSHYANTNSILMLSQHRKGETADSNPFESVRIR